MSLVPTRTAKYTPFIDILRLLAILMVVLIHTTTKILDVSGNQLSLHFFTFTLNQASRFAVPLFFFISAYVLELNYPAKFNYFSYLKKRFSRLFLPYLFWTLIYYFFVYPNQSHSLLHAFILGDASYQLYFIPTLFLFYLIFPLLHKYQYHLIKFILPLFVFQLLLLAFDYYQKPLSLPYPLSVLLLNFFFFFYGLIAFHYQDRIVLFIKKYLPLVLISLLSLLVFLIAEAFILYQNSGNYLYFYSQWRPSIFLYSLLLISLLLVFTSKLSLNPILIKTLALYSFPLYFIHVLVIEFTWHFMPSSLLLSPSFSFFIVTLISSLLVFLLSKIPLLSRLIG